MATTRTVDFLPPIFQTDVNKQFLGATLDQLVQEPAFQRTQGFIGRTVGPGVNPDDKYVVEPNKTRRVYQLEPGIIINEPDTQTTLDAITYPGIIDALSTQGAYTDNADRLFTSQNYSWDPFVDFDKFNNYSQYYWLPGGPLAVDVSATDIPTTDNFVVTRENGVYTFSGVAGENPVLTLVRGGNYTFQVAQNNKETVNFRVTNNGSQAYVIDYKTNPTITVTRGNTYIFNLTLSGPYPFWIKTLPGTGTENPYNDGVTNNGAVTGQILWTVPQDAPDTLYYAASTDMNLGGTISVINATPGTGPGFWIQSQPGVNGRLFESPNISSRTVLGVENNGEDLGTVTFNVPQKTAQSFYYTLDPIGPIPGKVTGTVDLVTATLNFDQINNVYVDVFLAQYGGIDGITELDGKTLVFIANNPNEETAGWNVTTQFDPLAESAANNGKIGSYDTTLFDQTTPVPVDKRLSVWQITYVPAGERYYMKLSSVQSIAQFQKFKVQYGTEYSNYSYFKNASDEFEQIPLLTAILDTLYYQDGTDPEIFGRIKLIDQDQNGTIIVENQGADLTVTLYNSVITDKTLTFTSASGPVLAGMKLSGGGVTPDTYIVGGAGTVWMLNKAAVGMPDTAEIVEIVGAKNYTSPNGVVFTNGLKVTFRGSVIPESYINNTYYVEGVGTGIKLLPVENFVTPETYTDSATIPFDSTAFDVGNFDGSLNQPLIPDYLTINRASPDLNAWSRSNRWFHVQVINASAAYNNTVAVLDNNFRARRPILEFYSGTRLFNFGTQGKQPVDIFDFNTGDALSQVNGSLGYIVDGYKLITGSRIIFAADTDPEVRNKIYTVTFITPDTVPPLIAQPVINLTPADDAQVFVDQSVLCLSGNTLQGTTFYFDGVEWIEAQEKTSTNQAPLFDVYDSDGISFSNRAKYLSSNFTGSKLFSYAIGSGIDDTVLGFPLRYLSLQNVGDIVFNNDLYTETFDYVQDRNGINLAISTGFVRQYTNRTDYLRKIGWEPAVTPSLVRQQLQFTYDGTPIQLDVQAAANSEVPAINVFVNGLFIPPTDYTVNRYETTTQIILASKYVPGSIVEVTFLSTQISQAGFYQVPSNLENNPFGLNSPTFTLGTIRNHYDSIGENLIDLVGPINGSNNSRDLGDLVPYGQIIMQQSSPLTLTGYFLRDPAYEIFKSLAFNNREYIKFKTQLLDNIVRNDYTNLTVPEMLTAAITDITLGRTELNPFYWSDMLPAGSVYTEVTETYTAISDPVFDLNRTYDFTSSNYYGLLVYVNDNLLLFGYDYVVATDGPRLTITIPLAVGDVITIQEYASTVGNFVPNTPTKMGLYPAFKPEIYYDVNAVNPQFVIRGHDGSITATYGDVRDDILLEFEKRIYNNLKIKSPVPLTIEDVLPGQFRTTDYTSQEITQILGQDFLIWVADNQLDYKTQNYVATNEFTWNYSLATNKLDNTETLLGAWRGINRYFYDTQNPNLTPWEMLGFSEQPTWWADRYGPAPYTSDNLVLWDDLEAGIVADPAGYYIKPKYKRPGLTKVIPVDGEGNLVSPVYSTVGVLNSYNLRKSWVIGDGGPVEASWWNSSSYPFAVMRLLALTRPAEFFSLFIDRDLYKFNVELAQYLYNNRYRVDARNLTLYGSGVSKASYINWIIDYNQQNGSNTSAQLSENLSYLDVRLCYRFGAFTDKNYLKVFTEKSSPESQNTSLLLPDASYDLFLYKNQPVSEVQYSAVIVQKTTTGWTVTGYSQTQPFFEIYASNTSGPTEAITIGGVTVRVPTTYTNISVKIPYGQTFTNQTSLADFLLSYGAYLKTQGLTFNTVENGILIDWRQMACEFLYWSEQGWGVGSSINLNASAITLNAFREGLVVDNVALQNIENIVLDQNRQPIPSRNLVITRLGNDFTLQTNNNQAIAYVNLKYTSYEDIMILDNVSIFADLIYNPTTGARQNRVRISGTVSSEWNGTLDAQGFILNDPRTVRQWSADLRYSKGDIVLFKGVYWSALETVLPAQKFNFEQWVKSDYAQITKGLLPNLANKADQLANSYNSFKANLELDNDLLSFGLIGFKPRQYMVDINLDDISQVNVYKQFLGTKGTIKSAELFRNATLGKEVAQYDIYENWAVQRGIYGANANRSFFEIRTNQALLTSNPSTIQIIYPQQTSTAEQTVVLGQLWKQSYVFPNTNILPTFLPSITDTALPSAGYVNIDDVDITVFNLNQPNTIAADINNIGEGTKIWVAKTNNYDWNIYRTSKIAPRMISLQDNLDGSGLATFTDAHGRSKDDLIIIRYFNSQVNGVYRVLSVPSPNTLVIAISFSSATQLKIYGQGIVFYLDSMRVAQASDISTLDYVNQLVPGAQVWVDNNGQGLWTVLEKRDPFTQIDLYQPTGLENNSAFGTSVAQSRKNIAALVGAPGFESGAGSVWPYLRDSQNNLITFTPLTLTATGATGYGSSVALGDQTWGFAGAPTSMNNTGMCTPLYRNASSNVWEQKQLLVAPDQDFGPTQFGYAGAVSLDERWMYVSAPGGNKVYAYGLVQNPIQSVTYVTDGTTTIYNYSNSIAISDYNQIAVALGDRTLYQGTDYSINATSITLSTVPAAGLKLVIIRKFRQQLDAQTYTNVAPNVTVGPGIDATFIVSRVRGVYTVTAGNAGSGYSPGNTLTIYGTTVGGGTNPANNITITVTTVGAILGNITGFTYTGTGVTNTSVFPLSPYLATVTNIYSFTVRVNGVLQRPHLDYDFNSDSALDYLDLVFLGSSNPPAGAVILVSSDNYYQYVATLTVPGLPANAQFGYSLATTTDGRQVIVGTPNDMASYNNATVNDTGSVYVFDRSVVRYIVNNVTQKTYALPASFAEPVSVILNNEFLTNDAQYLNGDFNVVGSNVVLTNQVTLNIGDILEIESNIFQQIQKITAKVPFESANFGAAVDVCPTDCSLYTGAPQDANIVQNNPNLVIPQAGSVERNVNQAQLYGVITSTVANPTLNNGNTIRINNQEVAVPNAPNQNVAGLAAAINTSGIPNVLATVSTDGYLTISVRNVDAAPPYRKLSVLPGTSGTAFADLGFKPWVWTQRIVSPYAVDYAYFGTSVNVDDSAINLVVGAPRATAYQPTTFDNATTYFDERSTTFFNAVVESGVAYTFDYFNSANESATNPGQFAFGQQIYDSSSYSLDRFGTAVNYTGGLLMVGAPGYDAGDSAVSYGRVAAFSNSNNSLAWQPIHTQVPVVDVNLMNTVYIYNKIDSQIQTYLDFFDPLQGKILGAARQNIDYIGAVDPAFYNVGTVRNNGNAWSKTHVGQIWWDTNRVRFIDPNQDSISYAARRWGQVFPGSNIDVYQWVESVVPPNQYNGPGIPFGTASYSTNSQLNANGTFVTLYYFWVRGINVVNTNAGKTLSALAVALYIENPRSSGIPYLAPINANTVALYNSNEYLIAQDSILHVEYDREASTNNIHSEYELIQEGVAKSFLTSSLYTKLQDSFCGINQDGAPVPDPFLSPGERYGVQFRPRQSMFADRFLALENYLTYVNSVMLQFPVVENRLLSLLNSAEPEPTRNSGAWNKRVDTIEILSYQNIDTVAIGYKYLVVSDSTQNGYWTIYQVANNETPGGPRVLELVRIQNYDTKNYWYHVDWYLPGYNSSIQPVAQVANTADLQTLSVTVAPIGSSVQVNNNGQGKYEIYLRFPGGR